jgi:uncharacterized protein YqfA (UPF0365 family)
MPDPATLVVLLFAALAFVVVLVQFVFLASLLQLWLQAHSAGAPVPIIVLVMMRVRRSPARLLVETYITLRQRSVDATIADVERTYLANPDPHQPSRDLADAVERRVQQSA